jgi:carboxypeptidase Taq
MNADYLRLRERLAEVQDLGSAQALLEWDQRTMMPARGSAARAEALATVVRLGFERFASDEVGALLDALGPWAEALPYDSDEASLVRVTRREYDKARRVPATLKAEIARTAAIAGDAWIEARKASDYAAFQPHLERIVALRREYAACLAAPGTDPYDALLDDYEPGFTAAAAARMFEALKAGLVPLLGRIRERAGAVDDSVLAGRFPADRQRTFCLDVMRAIGFDDDGFRLDVSAHPFETRMAAGDVRMTTRYDEGRLADALFGCVHELGHALYESGVDPALARTPLDRGTSMGIHESQSRLWENVVGRGLPFWRCFYPRLQQAFPEPFAGLPLERFWRAINAVRPSLIRVEADEVTYNLHVLLRFELERALIGGDLAPADLPREWNARMREYLGIEVPDDRRGVLQDIHWSQGDFGYFPTYTLGNVIASQLWERATAEVPGLEAAIEAGDFAPLRRWLHAAIHHHGAKFTGEELLARVTGRGADPAPYLAYLDAKFAAVYGG